jgi:hypothetical protein
MILVYGLIGAFALLIGALASMGVAIKGPVSIRLASAVLGVCGFALFGLMVSCAAYPA